MAQVIEIIHRKTAELTPYAKNSRTHSSQQIDQIIASIREFGFTNPVLVDKEGGIIAGHGRLLAANRLGMLEIPTILLENLTETQKKAYIIADNKIALNSGWDTEKLSEEFAALAAVGFEVDLTGFDFDASQMAGAMAAADQLMTKAPTTETPQVEGASTPTPKTCPHCGGAI